MHQNKQAEIVICMGSSCFSRGNKKNLELIKAYLKANSIDDNVLFRGSHCLGTCEKGPMLIINGEKLTQVSTEEITELLEKHLSAQ